MTVKLYLVRRNLETLVGPMDLEQFKKSFAQMEFGLQDEVASHCSKWIFLEDSRALKKRWPEIHGCVYKNQNIWADSPPSRAYGTSVRTSKKTKKSPRLALALLFIVLGASGYGYKLGALDPIIEWAIGETLSAARAKTLLQEKKFSILDRMLENDLDKILSKSKGSDLYNWLPILRWYAFRHEGEIKKLPSKILKGGIDSSTPDSCSLADLKTIFAAGMPQWGDFLSGRQLPAKPWASLLAWDPHWIKRRAVSGWISPSSYAAACVLMARRAFNELSKETTYASKLNDLFGAKGRFYESSIRDRLKWMSYLTNTTAKPSPSRPSDLLSQWTCIEEQMDIESMQSCVTELTFPSPEARDYSQYRFVINLVKPIIFIDLDVRSVLTAYGTAFFNLPNLDPLSSLDMRAETSFLKQVQKRNGDIENALNRVRVEYVEVDLAVPYSW